jgi:hypothetical protein
MDETLTFKARPSNGWLWVLLIIAPVILPVVGVLFFIGDEIPLGILIFNLATALVFGIPFVLFAAWFPTMRYTLGEDALILRYGPVLNYRIPYASIKRVRSRNLQISMWSSMRVPGLALYTVPYIDVGNVKMCSTSASRNVLLIETEKEKYGITPADEQAFVAALTERLGR